jgi:hypothetical protein
MTTTTTTTMEDGVEYDEVPKSLQHPRTEAEEKTAKEGVHQTDRRR